MKPKADTSQRSIKLQTSRQNYQEKKTQLLTSEMRVGALVQIYKD